ncbi:MFS transporter [Salinactinospora qingdaonensis]|uniref:Major facilitator superfamily (MFS) profile domain-containing protein n=1 Tax=Salinactinospora qingdaonensis TaxID=702744 RepID=A0ABP7FUV1_9ACTN
MPSPPPRFLTVLLTAVMAYSMLQLFLLGAFAPYLNAELGVGPPLLGAAVAVGFATAALLSPVAGYLTDLLGPRTCVLGLFALIAFALGLFAAAPNVWVLLVAVAIGGLPQAFANPATNKVIMATFSPERRGAVTGWKQSGVQVGAFAAGLPLASLAAATDWRRAVALASVTALAMALWAALALPVDEHRSPPRVAVVPRGAVAWLTGFSVLLGCGIASVNAHLSLFSAVELGLGELAAGALVAVLGVAGVAGRVAWSRAAGGRRGPDGFPALLAWLSVVAALLLAVAPLVPWAVWPGAALIGVFAVAANAISMVVVMRRATGGRAGQDSALVSAGFFAGFAVGPPLFGLLVETVGYQVGWLLVAAEFALAGAVALAWRLEERRRAVA